MTYVFLIILYLLDKVQQKERGSIEGIHHPIIAFIYKVIIAEDCRSKMIYASSYIIINSMKLF